MATGDRGGEEGLGGGGGESKSIGYLVSSVSIRFQDSIATWHAKEAFTTPVGNRSSDFAPTPPVPRRCATGRSQDNLENGSIRIIHDARDERCWGAQLQQMKGTCTETAEGGVRSARLRRIATEIVVSLYSLVVVLALRK